MSPLSLSLQKEGSRQSNQILNQGIASLLTEDGLNILAV
jgi:hypothetical protein